MEAMCLLLFHLNPSASEEEFYLILINVRDEFYNRPTKLAHEWLQNPDIIGGVDIEPGREGGTWLAMRKSGKLASLLNILQPDEELYANKKGRGFLVVNYVNSNEDCLDYLQTIQNEEDSYNGFTLVTMDFSSFKSPKVAYFSNMLSQSPTLVQPGIHAFGNSSRVECPWPKVSRAKELFTKVIQEQASVANKEQLVESLFNLLRDSTCCHVDENMKKQGKDRTGDFMEKLSSIFVNIPDFNYGSRCHTIILIDGSGQVEYIEKSRSETSDAEWSTHRIAFKLNL